MTVDPPSWTQAWDLNESAPNAVYTVDETGHYYEGYLVPDTRLQAIADAPKCEHGNVYRHIDRHSIRYQPIAGLMKWDWCEGSPEFAAAIVDALTEEEET
jgi:hypothetical protein